MSFTDEDLKRLKDYCDLNGPDERCVELVPQDVISLIARLEAAEAVCQSVIDNGDESNFKFSMKAWRKAVGK